MKNVVELKMVAPRHANEATLNFVRGYWQIIFNHVTNFYRLWQVTQR
jgi:hypothetical protein